jgi:hypothetical protein
MIAGTKDNRMRNTEGTQPTLLSAIALELTYVNGGSVQQHARGARRMLESAFRSLKHKERVDRQSRAVHAA